MTKWLIQIFYFFNTVLAVGQTIGDNLARGRPYTMDPPPNYTSCSDREKANQLTDGVFTTGRFWSQKTTSGWKNGEAVTITVNLGKISPICGVSYNTAAGSGGATWPAKIFILVSDNGTDFKLAGELVSLSAKDRPLPGDGYQVYCYKTHALRVHAQFVSFVVSPSGPFTFTDEVEVYSGDPSLLELEIPGQNFRDLKSVAESVQIQSGIERRIRQDLTTVRKNISNATLPVGLKTQLIEQLPKDDFEPNRIFPISVPTYRATLPLNSRHKRIFDTQARLWQALGTRQFSAWPTDPYSPMSVDAIPPQNGTVELNLHMMLNEYRAGAFNLATTTDLPTPVDIQITGLPGGTNPAYVTLNRVVWTDTKSGTPVASALEPMSAINGCFSETLAPGLVRQIWLSFHPTDVPAGRYSGKIELSYGTNKTALPLSMRIYPICFSRTPVLQVGGWDYSDGNGSFDITSSNRDSTIALLRDHFVESPWASPKVLPPGQIDATGKIIAPPDTTVFDEWVARWPNARNYYVFVNAQDRFNGARVGTPEFLKKVSAWSRFWANHATKKRIAPSQLILLLVDEPRMSSQEEIAINWARAIRADHTGIRVFQDLIYDQPSSVNQELIDLCDILCPHRPGLMENRQALWNYYRKLRVQGKDLALYSCLGPTHTFDPYSYYRLQAWQCWAIGAKASFFWAMSDAGGAPSWAEYAAQRTPYTPFYLGAHSATSSKHMEALREGVEDYEYLAILRQQIAIAKAAGEKNAAIERADRLLAKAPGIVFGAAGAFDFDWTQSKDRMVADRVRLEILEAIEQLR